MLAPRPNVRGPLPKHTPILVDALRSLGCDVELLPWGRRSEAERFPAKIFSRASDVAKARRAVVRGAFSVVVIKTGHDWLTLIRDLALVYSLPRRCVVVMQFHGSQAARLVAPGSHVFKLATRALLARSAGVLVLSREEATEWKRFSPNSRLEVVRNPLPPLAAAAGSSEQVDERRVILFVARLIPSKGASLLVRALPLVQEDVACRLVVAGEGPEGNSLRGLISQLSLEGSVELAGYVEGESLTALYEAADVFALPTTHDEGFPTVILEAMASGLPIVTTGSRGVADHLEEEVNALFAPAGDVPGLAARLVRVLSDSGLAARLGEANREKAREFGAANVAREYLDALEAIVEAARPRADGSIARTA
jgi:glycosyltransferase involved in cell wall biosynthesis